MRGTLTSFSVYPNPFQEECVIEFGKVIHKGNLKVINELGQIMVDKTVSNKQETIVAPELSRSEFIF
ncbi:MAG: T9SS type A sorting domain-containing protein [Bacteroidetes bacterium]|nr:T9SS type A sorting domain-containing protein [Bacteroidota bacterium]